jgi:hypothetical protein
MTDRKWYTFSGFTARIFARLARRAARKRSQWLAPMVLLYGFVELFGVRESYRHIKSMRKAGKRNARASRKQDGNVSKV